MTTDSRPNPTDKPRRPALDHREAMRLAATEYDRVIAQLRALSAEDWTKPTECVGWDVRAMACHMLGMAEMVTSRREQKRQVGIAEAAQKAGAVFIDALTDLQVTERKDLTSAQIIERFVAAAPRAAKFRRRLPAPARRFAVLPSQPIGPRSDSPMERWALGYLMDVIMTRDPWMHRTDIALVTGREMTLTTDHDGAIVADAAREWADRHGQPVHLELTGSAGGAWTWGEGGPTLVMDAVEFCRVLASRGHGEGLLAVEVPF